MLTPEQVIPFLTDERPWVRDHALRSLMEAGNRPEALTPELLWEAIDRFGMDESRSFLRALDEVGHTEASYQRLVAALADPSVKSVLFNLHRVFESLPFELVEAHRDELLSNERLPSHVRDHLRQRLELAQLPSDVLWERLLAHSNQSESKYADDIDRSVSGRLIEAMARVADSALIERAMTGLRDPAIVDQWAEIFLVQFLGRVRHEPAIDLLLEKLLIEDADILNEEAYKALARIGTLEVVSKCESAYAGKEWGVRLFVREPIHRVWRTESEEALCRLVDGEESEDLQNVLLNDLCYLGSVRGLERARRMIESDPADPENKGLCEVMLATVIMNGVEIPEAAAWTTRVEAEWHRLKKLLREMDAGFDEETEGGELGWADERLAGDEAGDPGSYLDALDRLDGLLPVETYRRESPKVGRNDPCPCGSGKKYKKCCGG